ncbi:MAG: DMT family transporter, partial [Candidatus Cloacimonetes bacterium]|nr:DMT family transporter [Candidatus Cloacimonadota bacterium]
RIGSRVSMLIMSTGPVITTILGTFVLGEYLEPVRLFGMFLTVLGVGVVILKRNGKDRKFSFSRSPRGLLYAFGGAFGQSLGLVLSKYGMQNLDAFASNQIRVSSGIIGFIILFTLMRKWSSFRIALKNIPAMRRITLGAFFGPFLGVSFSLLAVSYTLAGVASTIFAIVPVLIIPPAVILFREKINLKEIGGAVIAVFGVALMFL